MLYTTKEKPTLQVTQVKGSERVDNKEGKEKETLMSHKSQNLRRHHWKNLDNSRFFLLR